MINKGWNDVLKEETNKSYFKDLGNKIRDMYKNKIVYPEYNNIFKALKYTGYDDVKVVILGQDPYHGENQAHGLSFSVSDDVSRPPSLVNILKELENDLGIKKEGNNLESWAKQGVFLLNAIMTVEKDKPLSHRGIGWEQFTDSIIKKLNEREKPIVFVLWGNYARSKKGLITNKKHLIIESVHPSPLSAHRGFFGSKPFSKINNFLEKNNIEKIKW
ncbi:MAG: uracil-DNA glycosylase [Ignavibacteriales bacterium]